MSFIGTLVVWRGSGDIEGPVAAELDFQPFQKRGAWTVAYLSEELVDDEAKPLLTEICRSTRLRLPGAECGTRRRVVPRRRSRSRPGSPAGSLLGWHAD